MTPCSCALPPGVIAQEVEEVVPELVIQPNTTANPSEYKRVDYNGFIPIMLESLNALQADNDALASKVRFETPRPGPPLCSGRIE